jgi:hypothetical protein
MARIGSGRIEAREREFQAGDATVDEFMDAA